MIQDGILEIKLSILNITTYAKNEADVITAVNEAVESLKIQALNGNCIESIDRQKEKAGRKIL